MNDERQLFWALLLSSDMGKDKETWERVWDPQLRKKIILPPGWTIFLPCAGQETDYFLRMASSHPKAGLSSPCSSPCPTKIVTDTFLNEFSNSMASPTVSCFSTDSTFSPCLFEGDTEISYKSSWNKISGKIFFRANSQVSTKEIRLNLFFNLHFTLLLFLSVIVTAKSFESILNFHRQQHENNNRRIFRIKKY